MPLRLNLASACHYKIRLFSALLQLPQLVFPNTMLLTLLQEGAEDEEEGDGNTDLCVLCGNGRLAAVLRRLPRRLPHALHR